MEQSKITEWEVVDNFGILTINNPPQNFLTEPEIVSLSDLQRWTSNETLRGLIVQGKGRHFSAGADKNNILTAPDEEGIRNNLTKGKKVLDYLWDLPIPTIAAIRGYVLAEDWKSRSPVISGYAVINHCSLFLRQAWE